MGPGISRSVIPVERLRGAIQGEQAHWELQAGWKTFEPYLLVEETVQMRRRADLPPLNREEFRALCDQHDSAEAIRKAFADAP